MRVTIEGCEYGLETAYECLLQERCGVPKDVAKLIEQRQWYQFCRDLREVDKACRRFMDERMMLYGVFNAWLSDAELWSARDDDSVMRFIRRRENEEQTGEEAE